GEAGERDTAGGGAVLEEQVSDLDRAQLGLHDVGPELRPQPGAGPDAHALQRLLAVDLDVGQVFAVELDGVVHGLTPGSSPPGTPPRSSPLLTVSLQYLYRKHSAKTRPRSAGRYAAGRGQRLGVLPRHGPAALSFL